jgi:hypothetical protein
MNRRSSDHTSTVDDSAWLSARISPGGTAIFYKGTEGDDRLLGSNFDDYFDMSQGGDDVVQGRQGDDVFYFGSAFTGADRVDGGTYAGTSDMVILDGDYSAGITFEKESLQNVQLLGLVGGSYVITGSLGFSGLYGDATIDATSLTGGQTLDIQVETTGRRLVVLAGEGDDILHGAINHRRAFLNGGAGDDTLISGAGRTEFSGGAGADHIVMMNRKDGEYFGSASESTASSYDLIDGFRGRADGGRNFLYLSFDSNDSNDVYERSFHLGATPGRSGDILFHYDAALDHTVVEVFTNPDSQPDFVLHLSGELTLTVNDFRF